MELLDWPKPGMKSRITDEMYARIPALLEQGMTTAYIAAMYGVTLGTLKAQGCRRGISLREGGPRPKRSHLLPPLSKDANEIAARGSASDGQGQHGAAGQRPAGEDRQRQSLQGGAGRGSLMIGAGGGEEGKEGGGGEERGRERRDGGWG